MGINDQIARAESQTENSAKSSPVTGEINSISVYQGSLNPGTVFNGMKKLKGAFPQLPKEFYEVLTDRIWANGFSDQRFRDAVNHVIDTCVYPTPTIANIIDFDQRVRLHTYDDMVEMNDKDRGKIFNKRYKRLKNGMYASIGDIEKFKLT